MTTCRGCLNEIQETVANCPYCGDPQPPRTKIPQQWSILKLIMWCAIWTIIFWFCLLLIAGFIAGAYYPQNPAAAGARVGEAYGELFLLISFCVSAWLTYLGKLPGTKKPK